MKPSGKVIIQPNAPSKPSQTPQEGEAPLYFFKTTRRQVYALIIFNLLLFINTLPNRFTYDDMEYIVGNASIQNPAKILKLFAEPYPPHRPNLSLYRPIVSLTYLLDWCRSLRPSEFADMNFNDRAETPFFHLTNILIHIGTVLTLLFLARRLLGSERAAFAAALIFSAHPVHVEAVASLVGRAESLCAFFFLLSLVAHIGARKEKRLFAPLRILSWFFFAASLMSKETAVTLPPAILLTDWFFWLRQKDDGGERENFLLFAKNAIIRLLPFTAVFILYLIIRLKVLGVIGINPDGWYFWKETTAQRLAAMSAGSLAYWRLLTLPVAMSPDYNFPVRIWGPFWAQQPGGFLNGWALAGIAVGFLYAALAYRAVKNKSALAYPLIFFPIVMFPFSNIMPFGDFIAERFLYLPSVSVSLAAGIFYARAHQKSKWRKWAFGVFCFLLIFYSIRTYMRNLNWRSGVALWEAELRLNPRSAGRYSALGAEYSLARWENIVNGNIWRERGDFKKAAHYLELARYYESQAIKTLELAMKEDPQTLQNYYNYSGLCVEMLEPDLDRAEQFLMEGLRYSGTFGEVRYVMYYYIGLINLKRVPPRLETALDFFHKSANRLKGRQLLIAMNGAASAYAFMGRYDECYQTLREILAIEPADIIACRRLRLLRHKSEGLIE